MSIKKVISLLRMVNIWKTIYINFHYFPTKIALFFPIFIYKRVGLNKLNGSIVLDSPIRTGMIRFGLPSLGIQDYKYERTILELSGKLVFMGSAFIGQGSKLCIGEKGVLSLGNGFKITGNSEIICQKEIIFGSNCLLSWDILIMDSDFHFILNQENQVVNHPNSIIIGDHVWIGCRSILLKGVKIARNNVISANSTITRSLQEENCIVCGFGKSLEIIRKDINWKDKL